ncbi:hypothetical protein [Sandarakinorhabdus sp.]|uniref:hypothetical protein n=1 Tax=Sandarakinorhabdus sp. TaxID=1916663 RepID=UPI00286DFDDB|nr:hypothetical protein [Sandarakinorhabdus sp.]
MLSANLTYVVTVFAILAILWGVKILNGLNNLNKQIENVRYYLGQIENRQQRMADKIHGIEHHTGRAVKHLHASDEWDDLHG